MPGRTFSAASAYRYGFNGKEQDSTINGTGVDYDYGMRMYDARVGRWYSTDPVVKPWLTSYQYAANNPLNNIDANGQDEFHFHTYQSISRGANGTILSHTTSRIEIIKADGPDRYYYHTHVTFINIPGTHSNGGMATSEGTVHLYPWTNNRSGVTSTSVLGVITNSYWGGDRDYVTLIKFINANPQLKQFIEAKANDKIWDVNDADYKQILRDAPKFQTLENIKLGAELTASVVSFIDAGLTILKFTENPFVGLTPGEAGSKGEELMYEHLAKKYEGQNVTITEQVYIKMHGKSLIADAVVSDDGTVLEVAESKYNTSEMKPGGGQDMFFKGKTPGKFVGSKAEGAGLKNLTVDPSKVKLSEYRWSLDGSCTIIKH